jgi:S-adenosylmethionine hydrolase
MSANPTPPVALLTDFGTQDTYVAEMHAVLASLAPQVRVIDLTHAIDSQNILQGAVALGDAVEVFPRGTIFVAVVDPGVGSARRAVAAEIGDWRFVGPDNGLLTGVLQRWPLDRGVSLTNAQYFRSTVSRTFHGRDVFAPVAAHWATGVPLEQFGPPLDEPLQRLPWPKPVLLAGGVTGEVLAVDHFGNLLTNLSAELWADRTAVPRVSLAGRDIGPLVACYADRPGEPLALIGSHGRLEIAVDQGSAAAELGCGVGTAVTVVWS